MGRFVVAESQTVLGRFGPSWCGPRLAAERMVIGIHLACTPGRGSGSRLLRSWARSGFADAAGPGLLPLRARGLREADWWALGSQLICWRAEVSESGWLNGLVTGFGSRRGPRLARSSCRCRFAIASLTFSWWLAGGLAPTGDL